MVCVSEIYSIDLQVYIISKMESGHSEHISIVHSQHSLISEQKFFSYKFHTDKYNILIENNSP